MHPEPVASQLQGTYRNSQPYTPTFTLSLSGNQSHVACTQVTRVYHHTISVAKLAKYTMSVSMYITFNDHRSW